MQRAYGSDVTALIVVMLAQGALAQDKPLELTPAGKAILQSSYFDRQGKPMPFPLAICAFPGGLCGAVQPATARSR